MSRFRLLPLRHHGVHWVMLIILVLHALAPHGGWRVGAGEPRPDLVAQNLAPPDADAALGFICGVGEAGRKTLPLHDSDGPRCPASAPPPSLPVLVMAAVLSSVVVRLPVFDALPVGTGSVHAHPWPNAPPVRRG